MDVDDADDDDNESLGMNSLVAQTASIMTARESSSLHRREPPVRRVSRKTSYDSRVSDFDDSDDFDSDEE
jgi:hypothetical protein